MKVGDLISFKPKSFGDDDWSNPGIVLDSYEHDATPESPWKDLIWVVWIDGYKCMVNERNDNVVYLTSSSQKRA